MGLSASTSLCPDDDLVSSYPASVINPESLIEDFALLIKERLLVRLETFMIHLMKEYGTLEADLTLLCD